MRAVVEHRPAAPLCTPRAAPPRPAQVPTMRADQLTTEQKRQLFAWMREHDPEQAAFWKDPGVAAVREFYEAVAVFEVPYLRRAGVIA